MSTPITTPPTGPARTSRRSFLRSGVQVVAGMGAFVAALEPLSDIDPDDWGGLEGFLQKHYKEMTDEDLQAALARIEADVRRRFELDDGEAFSVRDIKPKDGVEFVYALNLSRCIGCRRCVHACVQENNQGRPASDGADGGGSPEVQYIRVLEMPKGTLDLEQGDHHYDRPTVPDRDHFYLPVQCHQCDDAPCVKVCPVEATWTEDDGITVVDYDWCIGCRYCEAACPYWARRFNFTEPKVPKDELNRETAYLSNRPRPSGVIEKCTFCLHRTREGRMPACLEACPVGARKFGNVLDPTSEVAAILKDKRVFVLKEELGTLPRFFYYFDERHARGSDLEVFEELPGLGGIERTHTPAGSPAGEGDR